MIYAPNIYMKYVEKYVGRICVQITCSTNTQTDISPVYETSLLLKLD